MPFILKKEVWENREMRKEVWENRIRENISSLRSVLLAKARQQAVIGETCTRTGHLKVGLPSASVPLSQSLNFFES